MNTIKAKDEQTELILSGNLQTVMWKLSLPTIAAMVLFGLNAFLDAVFVGQLLGKTALSGVALAYPLTGIVMGVGYWIGTGAANVLSIAIGAKDINTQKKLLGTTTVLTLVLGVIFTVPVYFLAESLIRMMGGRGEILAEGVTYFQATTLGSIVWVYGLALNFIVRGEGKMKKAAWMMSYGLGVNILLNPLFIKGLGMGVAGAAWATNAGMLVYGIVGFFYFQKGKASFQSNIRSVSYDQKVGKQILKFGLPGFILNVMGLVQALVVLNAIVKVGTEGDLAFYAAANRIYLFLLTPLFGLMRALQPVIGINYGAKQYDRIKKSFWLFTFNGLLIIVPFWLMLTFFPTEGLGLILPDFQANRTDIFYFQIYLFMLPFLPLVFMALTLFPAIDKSNHASMIALNRQLFFYVPVMWCLPQYLGVAGVYYGGTGIDLVITAWIGWLIWKEFKHLTLMHQQISEKVSQHKVTAND